MAETKDKPQPKPKTTTKGKKVDLAQLAKQLVELTVLEVSQLSDILKDDYGLEPSQVAPVVAPATGDGGDQATDGGAKSQYDVILKAVGDQKVAVIKVVKDLTGLGLGEAKAIIDDAPKPVQQAVEAEEAQTMKTKLEEVGATVELA